MASYKIWVDADSCPAQAKNIILKNAVRLSLEVVYVANRVIPFSIKNDKFTNIVTKNESGSADDYIVEHVQDNDIVITRDIPLASRLLEKKVCVLNDRGTIFDSTNIKEYLSQRELSLQMYNLGIHTGNSMGTYGAKEVHEFASALDKTLSRKNRGL